VTIGVFGTLAWTIINSFASQREAEKVEATVKQIGDALMTKYVLPLEVIGLLLTAALIGAVIIAMKEGPEVGGQKPDGSKEIVNHKS
jgi:NADH-quinone oxidoreductase subunit J